MRAKTLMISGATASLLLAGCSTSDSPTAATGSSSPSAAASTSTPAPSPSPTVMTKEEAGQYYLEMVCPTITSIDQVNKVIFGGKTSIDWASLTKAQITKLRATATVAAERYRVAAGGLDEPPLAWPANVQKPMTKVVAELLDYVTVFQGMSRVRTYPQVASSYTDFTAVGAPQLIADDACADWFLLGDSAPDGWQTLDLAAHPVTAVLNDSYERQGRGGNALGDPRVALTWLVNELSGLGIPLRAGELVTTGTCVVPVGIRPGDEVSASLGELGGLTVRCS